jgi:hypothetical protein
MKSDREIDSKVGREGASELAEEQLLKLVREQDSNGFTLTVTFSDGRWVATTHDLDSGATAEGEGESFAEAWHLQDPRWD